MKKKYSRQIRTMVANSMRGLRSLGPATGILLVCLLIDSAHAQYTAGGLTYNHYGRAINFDTGYPAQTQIYEVQRLRAYRPIIVTPYYGGYGYDPYWEIRGLRRGLRQR